MEFLQVCYFISVLSFPLTTEQSHFSLCWAVQCLCPAPRADKVFLNGRDSVSQKARFSLHFTLTHSLSVLLPTCLSLELASGFPLWPEFFKKFPEEPNRNVIWILWCYRENTGIGAKASVLEPYRKVDVTLAWQSLLVVPWDAFSLYYSTAESPKYWLGI